MMPRGEQTPFKILILFYICHCGLTIKKSETVRTKNPDLIALNSCVFLYMTKWCKCVTLEFQTNMVHTIAIIRIATGNFERKKLTLNSITILAQISEHLLILCNYS